MTRATKTPVPWLAPACTAWESHFERGTFPYNQARRMFAPLREQGYPPAEITRRFARYLDCRGAHPDPDAPYPPAPRRFTPSFADFLARFAWWA